MGSVKPLNSGAFRPIREDLAGVQDDGGVEEDLEPALKFDEWRRLFQCEVLLLGNSDTVLAGDGAAQGDGLLHQLLEGELDAGPVCGRSIQDVGVEVAVAGVAVGRHGQPQPHADRLEAFDRLGHA